MGKNFRVVKKIMSNKEGIHNGMEKSEISGKDLWQELEGQ